jgi:hypothetical protein
MGAADDASTFDVVDLGMFARAWAVQTRRISWLLGAGTSAAAGVPTAARIVDDLLVRMYADAHGLVREALDPSNPAAMDRIRAFYNGANGMPALGTPSDYSSAFAAAMPDAAVRRQFLMQLFAERTPCFGQRVLGAFVVAGAADLLVTTNFDDLIERAVIEAHQAPQWPARLLTVAALQSSPRAATALSDSSWPLLVKVHGDFRETSLKNLDEELREQDETLRQAVVDVSRRFGLAVAGYSGRDESVMAMLSEASMLPGAWPAGLWWLTRNPDELPPPVKDLLTAAAALGVQTHIVRAANFDEVMGSLAKQLKTEDGVRAYLDELGPRPRVVDAPLPSKDGPPFPVLRMNALPVLNAPIRALRVPVPAGTTADSVAGMLRQAQWRGAAVLGPGEVLAFGDPSQLRVALGADTEPVVIAIDVLAATAPSHVQALIADALVRSLARRLPAKPRIRQRGNQLVLVEPSEGERRDKAELRAQFAAAYGQPVTGRLDPRLYGTAPDGTARAWAEGVRLHLDWRLDVLWLLFEPFTWVQQSADMAAARDRGDQAATPDPSGPWNTEHWAKQRFNETWAKLIDTWAAAFAPHRPTTRLQVLTRHLASEPGSVGGAFTIGGVTAWSRESR